MIYSHTLIRNGEPFTKLIFRQVLPFVDKALITVSQKSNDGTLTSLDILQKEFPNKMVIDTENVSHPSELTKERQKQLSKTPNNAWVLFLDADDYWPISQLELIKELLNEDVDGLSVNPFQIVNQDYHDISWNRKYFLKWFINQKGVHYEKPWPRDLIFKGKEFLYWKVNPRVPKVNARYFHLSNLMSWKFRDESWATEYKAKLGTLSYFERRWDEDIKKIYEAKNSIT